MSSWPSNIDTLVDDDDNDDDAFVDDDNEDEEDDEGEVEEKEDDAAGADDDDLDDGMRTFPSKSIAAAASRFPFADSIASMDLFSENPIEVKGSNLSFVDLSMSLLKIVFSRTSLSSLSSLSPPSEDNSIALSFV